MGDKTIGELRADLAAAEREYVAAVKDCPMPDPNPLYGCIIDRRHLEERVQDAAEAHDAAETALWAEIDAQELTVDECVAAGVVLL